jgi:dTDP-4-dehydrorhamnose reductase
MTKGTYTKVIHLSTDCIFDGKDINGYDENSTPTETNWYGRSKAIGELNNEKDLTLRQSIIGPAPQASNRGFLNWINRGFTRGFWLDYCYVEWYYYFRIS